MGSSGNGVVSWIVVFMAALSLFMMFCVLQIDGLVRIDFYRFGLRFSYVWAFPFSTMVRLVFLFGWLNIAAAIIVHMRALAFKRRKVQQLVTKVEAEPAKKESSVPASEKPAGEIIVRESIVSENQPAQPVQNEQKSPIVPGITPEELKRRSE